jgi:hypothetical protein
VPTEKNGGHARLCATRAGGLSPPYGNQQLLQITATAISAFLPQDIFDPLLFGGGEAGRRGGGGAAAQKDDQP